MFDVGMRKGRKYTKKIPYLKKSDLLSRAIVSSSAGVRFLGSCKKGIAKLTKSTYFSHLALLGAPQSFAGNSSAKFVLSTDW